MCLHGVDLIWAITSCHQCSIANRNSYSPEGGFSIQYAIPFELEFRVLKFWDIWMLFQNAKRYFLFFVYSKMNHYQANENWEILEHDWIWKIHAITQKIINLWAGKDAANFLPNWICSLFQSNYDVFSSRDRVWLIVLSITNLSVQFETLQL